MAISSTTSISGSNSGLQIGQSYGPITANFNPSTEQFEISANRACLQDLQTTNPRHDKDRIEKDKGGLLKDAYCWILEHVDFKRWQSQEQSSLLWVKGDPGKGKTMLLCGIIDELLKTSESAVVSFFFCQATDIRINHATAVLRGLIFMLVEQQPSLVSYIRCQYDKAGKQVFEDVNAWEALSEILTSILEDPRLQTTYLIIDALDECTTGLNRLLDFLAQNSTVYPHVKWIVSSRNWPAIQETLDTAKQKTNLWLELNEVSVSKAVAAFIHYKVQKLTEQKKYTNEICDAISRHLLSNAHGTFLWVALVCKALANVPRRHVQKKLKEFPSGLDELYRRMLGQINDSDDAELCKSLLSVITTVYRPITLDELPFCMDLPEEVVDDLDVAEIIGLCGSFLTFRGRTISLVHQSAKDFLLRDVVHEVFPHGKDGVHDSIVLKSLQVMSGALRRDIYSLFHPGYPIDRVQQPDPDPLVALRPASSVTRKEFWVEEPAWVIAQPAIPDDWSACFQTLEGHSKRVNSVIFSHDSKFLTSGSDDGLIKVWNANSGECFQTFEGHTGPVNSVTFSHDSTILASGSNDGMVKVWDANSGECLQTLKSHSEWVNFVTFSHDSKLLASASGIYEYDPFDDDFESGSVDLVDFSHDSKLLSSASENNTIKLWETSSGRCLQTLEGHSKRVNSVAFSHNSELLASSSDDGRIKVWNANSGECLQILEGHTGPVNSITFSHDSTILASGSNDGMVKVWDANSGECLQTLEGHSSLVLAVTFSHDSQLLASASFDITVRVWDANSGVCVQILKGHIDSISSVNFSHDSKLLVTASHDRTVKVWDASSHEYLQTLEDDGDSVRSVTFSYDSKLLSPASNNGTVKVWDTSSSKLLYTLESCSDSVRLNTFSYNSKLLALVSDNHTVKLLDTSSGSCLQTLKDHSDSVCSVAFSHDSKLVASASHDCIVKVWDTSSGSCLQTLEAHSKWVDSVTFSHDSKVLALVSDNRTVKLFDTSNGNCLQTLENHSSLVNSVTFSHDSKLVASASLDCTVKVWDTSSGQCLQNFEGHSDSVRSVTFSRDLKILVSISADSKVKVWDVNNGECRQGFDIGKSAFPIPADITNLYLKTDNGNIRLSLAAV
ncbi:hypothetical protein N7533_008651 [Penicillium manginii]|uniref:uncharacterized protein n=1 Tax=Penicillium manginii TaxID=203109 RepID=UPI002547535D|nr:uncharacterized protein N7533_008651 [Penicillium manginii]KAJ5743781.1 hypothetical protein N7533_008651 [Penicillium manginii]